VFNSIAQATIFVIDIDFEKELEQWRSKSNSIIDPIHYLRYNQWYIMMLHDGALLVLNRFLMRNSTDDKIGKMHIDAIMTATRVVLNTNCYAFENK
jgi:hypothetical protein